MPFYLTTAIDYVNGRPHLGQAYEKVASDVIARYKRLCGVETHFVMGNDEHSQNVYKKAKESGLDPLDYCAEMEQVFRARWSELDVSFDDFIRTTEPRHRAAVQQLAQRSFDAGDIYEGTYEGWYCVSCEAFKPEKDLVEGRCAFHPTLTPEWIKEKNFFFRLSKYRDRLLAHFEQNPTFLQPDMRRNEILRLLESGLEDISMSRAGQAWGIPLPFAPANVVYVWFDALINYIAAVGYGTDEARFAHWWPANLHVIGKDITRFHTVVWPAMLWSAGIEPPQQVFGHGWINYGGQRMSKTLGTSVEPGELVAKFGADPARLYLTKEIAFGQDGDFTWERYEERYNADLANNLGNLVSRVAAMVQKYRGGLARPAGSGGPLAQVVADASRGYHAAMSRLAIHEAAGAAFDIITATNGFVAESAPWALAKDPQNADRLDAVLFEAAEAVRAAAVLLLPVMPSAAAEIMRRVGDTTPLADVRLDRDAAWRPAGERAVSAGPALWPRTDLDAAAATARTPPSIPTPHQETTVNDTTGGAAPVPPPAPVAPAADATPAADAKIVIDDFMKVELRAAKVLAAEAVPKSKKLIRLSVDVGEPEPRTILAGIAEGYQPAELVGRMIAVVANLKPAKLMGIESNGMVLAASPEGGAPILVGVDERVTPGTRIR
ncbi:MAG TPA: methionine--tRNA ligase [Vicinamibacterales bacterium]